MSARRGRVSDSARTKRKTIESTAPIGGRCTPRNERKSASENVVAARADGDEEAHAVAHRARRAPLPRRAERDERGGEQAEDVDVDGAERERRGRGTATRDTRASARRRSRRTAASGRRPRAGLARDDVLEEVDRELRQEDREHAGDALPEVGAEEAGERLARVPERDVGREGGEEPVHRPPPAQQHASAIASASTAQNRIVFGRRSSMQEPESTCRCPGLAPARRERAVRRSSFPGEKPEIDSRPSDCCDSSTRWRECCS